MLLECTATSSYCVRRSTKHNATEIQEDFESTIQSEQPELFFKKEISQDMTRNHYQQNRTRFLLPKNISQKEWVFSCGVNALQKAAKCLRFFLEQLQRAVSRRGVRRGVWGAEGKGKSSSCCCSTEPLPLPFFEPAPLWVCKLQHLYFIGRGF